MTTPADVSTRVSLLGRLRDQPDDPQAWARFVVRYGPVLRKWCRQWRLQDADSHDLEQEVLVRLVRKLRDYEHHGPGSFRGWLKTIARRALLDFLEACNRPGAPARAAQLAESLTDVAAREDLLKRLDDEFDCELLELAIERVKQRVQPHTWEAFRLTAYEERAAAEVGKTLGMQPGAVYVARAKVQRMIQEELARLDRDELVTEAEP